jgi:hypothetical protein
LINPKPYKTQIYRALMRFFLGISSAI